MQMEKDKIALSRCGSLYGIKASFLTGASTSCNYFIVSRDMPSYKHHYSQEAQRYGFPTGVSTSSSLDEIYQPGHHFYLVLLNNILSIEGYKGNTELTKGRVLMKKKEMVSSYWGKH